MSGLLIDANVLLDIFEDDPVGAQWSEEMLEYYSTTNERESSCHLSRISSLEPMRL